MYTVYVLKDKDGKLYKGMTNNFKRRLEEHKGGHTITTSRMKGIELVYSEEFNTVKEARVREKEIKSNRKLKESIIRKLALSSIG